MPLFEPLHGDSGYYNVFKFHTIDALKDNFPDGAADEYNVCLFSTSGVHGSYCTIEDVEKSLGTDEELELTVVIFHPRTVCMKYGHIKVGREDIPYLKRLRQTSWDELLKMGRA